MTAVGSSGFYLVGSLVAGNLLSTPTAGGTITINTTSTSGYGFDINTGSLISFGAASITSRSSSNHAVIFRGTGAKMQSASDITISGTQGNWGLTMYDNSFIQSTGGNILITASGTSGGMYFNTTGGIYASSNTATPTAIPTAGGSITINSSSSYNDITGAALRLDGHSTKIIAFGDINIYANGAASGLNVANQQGHGIILWGGAQVVRSVNGAISMTGYANRAAGGVHNWANISGGVTLYDGGVTIRAKGNLTLNGVSSSGIGLYLTYTAGTGGGITSDEGNILMNGLSNAASYGGALIRLPITATLGSVTFSGSGQNYGYYQDAWYGSVWAKTDVNLIGYATNGHGIYLGIGSVTSGDGNVILSGYTSSATTTDYGIYSNGINASASNGSVTFQGSQLDNVTTLANAISSRVTNTRPDPYFAIADAAFRALVASA